MGQLLVFRCACCDTPLIEDASRKKRSDTKYCSAKCRQRAHRKRVSVEKSVSRVSAELHDIVKQYYTETKDENVRSDCKEFMRGVAKLLKYELAAMDMDMTYQIRG